MVYLTWSEYTAFKKVEQGFRTELNSPIDIAAAREKAYAALGYSPYRGKI